MSREPSRPGPDRFLCPRRLLERRDRSSLVQDTGYFFLIKVSFRGLSLDLAESHRPGEPDVAAARKLKTNQDRAWVEDSMNFDSTG